MGSNITKVKQWDVTVRGHKMAHLMEYSFAGVLWTLITGRSMSSQVADMINAMLIAACDYGEYPPSTVAARHAASCEVPLQNSVIAGLACLGKRHGTIEACVDILEKFRDGAPIFYHVQHVPGFGHPIHKKTDPRAKTLLKTAQKLGFHGDYCQALLELEGQLKKAKRKRIPTNLAGALAAISMDMGGPKELGSAIFITGRSVGLMAHAYEQAQSGEKMLLGKEKT